MIILQDRIDMYLSKFRAQRIWQPRSQVLSLLSSLSRSVGTGRRDPWETC